MHMLKTGIIMNLKCKIKQNLPVCFECRSDALFRSKWAFVGKNNLQCGPDFMPKKAFAPVATMPKSAAQVGSLSSFGADLSSDVTPNKCFSRQLCNRCVLASQPSAGNYSPTQRLSNQALMCECDPCHSRTNA